MQKKLDYKRLTGAHRAFMCSELNPIKTLYIESHQNPSAQHWSTPGLFFCSIWITVMALMWQEMKHQTQLPQCCSIVKQCLLQVIVLMVTQNNNLCKMVCTFLCHEWSSYKWHPNLSKMWKTSSAAARDLHQYLSVFIKLQEIALALTQSWSQLMQSLCTAWEEQTDVHRVFLPKLKWLYVMWPAMSPSVPQLTWCDF